MMTYNKLTESIKNTLQEALKAAFSLKLKDFGLTQPPSPPMGDISFPCFELAGRLKRNPAEIAEQLASALGENEVIARAEAQGPYVNFFIQDQVLFESIVGDVEEKGNAVGNSEFGKKAQIVLEYSSPNTNKPQHLGHIRNNALGDSMARILESQGFQVVKVGIINDRGIHISKSMLMYQKYGENKSPKDLGLKSDHFVGHFYVMFEEKLKSDPGIEKEAQELLVKWEAGDKEVRLLWKKLNDWVYKGWDETYKLQGITFDKLYYESDIYEKGKEVVEHGLKKGLFYKRDDGAIEVDLEKEKLDKKVLLRSDGTSVYITQDLYLAKLRTSEYPSVDTLMYVVGKDQEYHFQVLFVLLKKLGLKKNYHHLSYGMVRLPTGKMSSRKGTVIHADDLVNEVIDLSGAEIKKRDEKLSKSEAQKRAHAIGLGALKYYILHVDPKKDIVFDGERSVRFEGDTGPYIQYTYARMQSILRRAGGGKGKARSTKEDIVYALNNEEREVVNTLGQFQSVVQKAAEEYNPAHIAHYLFGLAGSINSFYHKHEVLSATGEDRTKRLTLLNACSLVIKKGLNLLGIEAIEKM